MSRIRNSLGGIVMSICELLVGILLLINPVNFTTVIIVGFGWLMLISGLMNAIDYFRTPPEAAAKEQLLAKGLGVMLLGLFCIFRSGWFIAAFPLLTLLYAVAILLMSLVKVQRAVDAVRMKRPGWYWWGVGAATSLAFAILDFITLAFTGKAHSA